MPGVRIRSGFPQRRLAMTINESQPNPEHRRQLPKVDRHRMPPYSQVVIDSLPKVWLLDNEGTIVGSGDDLAVWIEENIDGPVLASAHDALRETDDLWRRRRLIARRSRLAIIEINPTDVALPDRLSCTPRDLRRTADQPTTRARIRIGHWWKRFGDMRPFFKLNGLAKPEIEVEVVNLRLKTVSKRRGSDYLFGVPYAGEPSVQELFARWSRRGEPLAAIGPDATRPLVWQSYGPRLGGNPLPWSALEAAWRVLPPLRCPNCHIDMIPVAFGARRDGRFRPHLLCQALCTRCRRLHESPLESTQLGNIRALIGV